MGDKIAYVISVIFHPLLMITYALLIFLKVNPYAFGVYDMSMKMPFVLMVFALTFFFPFLVLFLLKKLGFVQTVDLHTARERIIPYIATSVFFLWFYVTTRSNPEIPSLFKAYVLGSISTLFMVFFINNFSKVSAHMAGITALIVFSVALTMGLGGNIVLENLLGPLGSRPANLPTIMILLTGILASCRLKLNAHTRQELLGGFILGILGQVIAYKVYF